MPPPHSNDPYQTTTALAFCMEVGKLERWFLSILKVRRNGLYSKQCKLLYNIFGKGINPTLAP